MLTREFIDGQWIEVDEPFRQYDSPSASSADYADFMQGPRYAAVHEAPTWQQAAQEAWKAGYATDPDYVAKLEGIQATTPEQRAFRDARVQELAAAGVDPVRAELGWRQSALETGWGEHLAGGQNFYGIKGGGEMPQNMPYNPMQQMAAQSTGQPAVAPPPGSDPLAGMQPWAGPPMRPTGLDRWMEGGLSSPMAQAGAYMLANPSGMGGWAQSLGKGLMAGGNVIAQQDMADQELFELQQKREEFRQKKKGWGRQDELRSMIEQLPEPYRTMAKLNPEKAAEYIGQATGIKPKVDFKEIRGVAGEVRKDLGAHTEIAKSLSNINEFLRDGSAVSGQAAVTALAKLLDPGSVVRESETAAIRGSLSYLQQLQQLIQQGSKGGLTPELREQIGNVVNTIANTYEEDAGRLYKRYGGLADRYNIDPRDIGIGPDTRLAFARYTTPLAPAAQAAIEGGTMVPEQFNEDAMAAAREEMLERARNVGRGN